MPPAGSIPKQVPWKNSAHILAKQISNAELHERTGMLPISLEVKKRRWRWIGHINRIPPTSIPRVTMRWTSAGTTKRDGVEIRGAINEGFRVELGPQSWQQTHHDGAPGGCWPYVRLRARTKIED